MKRQILSVMSVLCALALCINLLPASVRASGGDWYRDAYSYEELLQALADPEAEEITIYPIKYTNYETGEGTPFQWPEEDVTLELKAANATARIWLGNGTLTIPENVTVNAYETLHLGAPSDMKVVVDGTWNVMGNQGYIGGVGNGTSTYGALEVNGTMTVAEDIYVDIGMVGGFVLNGTLINNASSCVVGDLILGDGAVVTGNTIRAENINCPSGSALLDCEVRISDGENYRWSGNLDVESLMMNSGSLVVAEGSHMLLRGGTVGNSCTMQVDGILELPKKTRFSVGDLKVSQTGTLIVRHGVYITGSGTVSGDGWMKLYAQWRENDVRGWYDDFPNLFYTWANDGIADAVTVSNIWMNWADAAECAHSWDAGVETLPTCGEDGFITFTCDFCGTQKESNGQSKTDLHTLNYSSGKTSITQHCTVCDYRATANLSAVNGKYADGAPVETATISYNEWSPWYGPAPSLTYTNNTEKGTATATMSIGDVSASVKFYIDDCAHEGGEATCTKKAVCTVCNQPYGDLAEHQKNYTYAYDSEKHYYPCKNAECTYRFNESTHNFYANYHDMEMDYAFGNGKTSHRCIDCYYGSFNATVENGVLSVELTKVAVGDHVFAAVYDVNGKFLGCSTAEVEKAGSATVTIPVTEEANELRVFSMNGEGQTNRPAACESISITK